MCHLAFSSKFVEVAYLLQITNIPLVWYLFLSCCLLMLNKLDSNFLAQKAPRKADQETTKSFCNCMNSERQLRDDFIRPLLYLLEPFPNTYY